MCRNRLLSEREESTEDALSAFDVEDKWEGRAGKWKIWRRKVCAAELLWPGWGTKMEGESLCSKAPSGKPDRSSAAPCRSEKR